MRKKIFVAVVFISLFLMASYTTALEIVNKADNKDIIEETSLCGDIFVDDDAPKDWYDETHVKTITEGINNATEENTIYVYNGTYYESIEINKTINLIGEDRKATIVDGQEALYTFAVYANHVTISNFTIQNSTWNLTNYVGAIIIYSNFTTVENTIITNNFRGIFIIGYYNKFGSHDNEINNNLFLNNDLELRSSNNNVIHNNIFKSESLISDCRLYLDSVNYSIIYNNTFSGIFIHTLITLKNSNYNIIKYNHLSDSVKKGIQLEQNSNNNDICNNNIEKNRVGIHIKDSNKNKIYDNNFKMCLKKASFTGATSNMWYHNYWGRPRLLPKIILGRRGILFNLIPWINIDFRPAGRLNIVN